MPMLLFFVMLIAAVDATSQSNPPSFVLSSGNYHLSSWSADSPAGTYPPNMIFHKCKTRDPKINDEMDSDWTLEYNLTSRSRIIGLGEKGFAFQNTSIAQLDDGAYSGAAVLALDATGRSNIHISWMGRTIGTGGRVYNIILQYRLGDSGSFISLPSVYQMSDVANDSLIMPLIVLPDLCDNQPLIQLRWKYYYTEAGDSGSRPQLGVDEIFISSGVFISVPESKDNCNISIMSDCLIIDGDISEIAKIEIFDISGALVECFDVRNINYRLPIKLKSGAYFVVISNKTGNSRSIKKIIKI